MKKQQLNEVKRLQELAGIKITEQDGQINNNEFRTDLDIQSAFTQAGIDLGKKCVVIVSEGPAAYVPEKVLTVSGKDILNQLKSTESSYEPGQIYLRVNPKLGTGDLMGDHLPDKVKGLTCKLDIGLSDDATYEIWQ